MWNAGITQSWPSHTKWKKKKSFIHIFTQQTVGQFYSFRRKLQKFQDTFLKLKTCQWFMTKPDTCSRGKHCLISSYILQWMRPRRRKQWKIETVLLYFTVRRKSFGNGIRYQRNQFRKVSNWSNAYFMFHVQFLSRETDKCGTLVLERERDFTGWILKKFLLFNIFIH